VATASNKERVAVISGGSSGIGRSFVAALHAEGYRIFTCGRDEEKLHYIEREFPGVRTSVCDMADVSAVRAFAAFVQSFSPAVDLLISNAGALREVNFGDPAIASAELVSEVEVNLGGPIQLVASFMPALRAAAPSNIVIITSGYALAPATRAPIYSAAKAGLHSFCKGLRRQLADLRIGVTEVAPPLVNTPSVRHRTGTKLSPDDVVRTTMNSVRRGHMNVLPGSVRWLPLLLRIAPGLAEHFVSGT
jgi:uncharacterized oxidoreductase